MEKKLLIASGNPEKIKEIKAILSILNLNIISGIDLNPKISVDETGTTYMENALLKAIAYQRETNYITLADDSGLEVDVLDGSPGIHSARYSPMEKASDADHRRYLLENLNGKPRPWQAHFYCTTVLVVPKSARFVTSGQCNGIIVPEEQGEGGFGYDPIFFLPGHNATMAEIPDELKNRISHRAKALQIMIPILRQVFITD